jgi:1-acyl-sn-glycerol-3-phosphate acyltransferase
MLAIGRLLAFVLVTLLLIPVQLVMCRLSLRRAPYWITKFYHRFCCRLFGIIRRIGARLSAIALKGMSC